MGPGGNSAEDAARRLLAKLRTFVSQELDEQEAALFAALVAPGVALAYEEGEVEAFGTEWRPQVLPEALSAALKESGVRITTRGRDRRPGRAGP